KSGAPNIRALVALLVAGQLCSGTVFGQVVESIDVNWAGTYEVGQSREIDDPRAPGGRRYVSTGVRPLQQTDRVPATVGPRFGIGYMLRGASYSAAAVSSIWRFPPAGITNPQTRVTTYQWETQPYTCAIGRENFCFSGYAFRNDWELVPGRWTVEVWAEGR